MPVEGQEEKQMGKAETPVLSGIGQKEDQILKGVTVTLITIVMMMALIFFLSKLYPAMWGSNS